MRRSSFLVRLFMVPCAALLITFASPAVARETDGRGGDRGSGEDPGRGGEGEGEGEGEGHSVPEFDLGTASAAFALLSGGLVVFNARRKQRKAAAT